LVDADYRQAEQTEARAEHASPGGLVHQIALPLLNAAVATGVALAGADMVPMTSAEDMAATTPAAVQRRWFTDILKSPLCWQPERARRR